MTMYSATRKTHNNLVRQQHVFYDIYRKAEIGDLLLFQPFSQTEANRIRYGMTYQHLDSISFRVITGIEPEDIEQNHAARYWLVTMAHGETHKGKPAEYMKEIFLNTKNMSPSNLTFKVETIDQYPVFKDIWDAGYKVSPSMMKTILGKDKIEELWLMLQLLEG